MPPAHPPAAARSAAAAAPDAPLYGSVHGLPGAAVQPRQAQAPTAEAGRPAAARSAAAAAPEASSHGRRHRLPGAAGQPQQAPRPAGQKGRPASGEGRQAGRAAGLGAELQAKYQALLARLGQLEGAVIAFSGGVDSSLVAYMAAQVLGPRALAVTSGSASLPGADRQLTEALAAEWGLAHRLIRTQELQNPNYRANPSNRCYFCKTTLYEALRTLATEEGFAAVLNGVNADDAQDFRPGLKAADEYRVIAPLAECGLAKDEVRRLAFSLGLRNAFKPQSACLSSRVPYGSAISEALLGQIERAESAVRALGFAQLRVRHHGALGRLELAAEALPQALGQQAALGAALLQAGYGEAALDVHGFRSGALNAVWRSALGQAPEGLEDHGAGGRLERAQAALEALGLGQCRPQAHGWAVSLRLPGGPARRQLQAQLLDRHEELAQALAQAGFSAVALSLAHR